MNIIELKVYKGRVLAHILRLVNLMVCMTLLSDGSNLYFMYMVATFYLQ